MTEQSIGKLRSLQQCASERGTFTCLALDHRQNLRRALNPSDPAQVSDADLTRFKLEVTAALSGQATAVLLDPEYSAAQAIAAGAVPGKTGLVVAVEATGYGGEPTARQSAILPGWSVQKVRRMGASMIKLLVYYHPDAASAREIEDLVQQTAAQCTRLDLGLMLEPLSYSLEAGRKTPGSAEKRYVVVETARRLVVPGVDILKAEFPLDPAEVSDENAWAAACDEISAASPAPWILLSAAAAFETYLRQVTIACQRGASGIAVGRAVWQEAVSLSGEQRAEFLQTTGRQRLARLTALCLALARPYQEFYTPPALSPRWYQSYAE